ncbi:hypothetical protein [Streptomyces sp. NPDC020965]|uniref:hypothetical protein n=1 Tax=Streptomyces sp. NPDC020965 TaxID=3365105 RepID=UPI0037BBDBDB
MVEVGVDGGEDQVPELIRLQRLHLPLHRPGGVEAVAAGQRGSPLMPSVSGSPYRCTWP